MSALVVAGLLAATAATLAVGRPHGPEPPVATNKVGLVREERIAELEAAGVQYEATITELRAELEGVRAEARAQGARLETSRQGIKKLNAMLAAMAARSGGRGTGGEGPQAGPQEAGEAKTDPAPAEAAARVALTGNGGDGLQMAGAPSYAATHPVKIRAAPDNAAEVLAWVQQGDVVRQVGGQGGWLRVEYTDRLGRDVIGWMFGAYLRRTEPPGERSGPPAQGDD